MSVKRMIKTSLLAIACLGLLMPAPAALGWQQRTPATPWANTPPRIADVSLQEGGILYGQVVDGQGVPRASAPVSLARVGGQRVTTRTNGSGWFQAGPLEGGTYQIVARRGTGVFRVWTPATAPPTAAPAILVVDSTDQVLGQRPLSGPVGYWLRNPFVVTGVVAVAVAVPVAIHNTRDDRVEKPVSP